jgi:hypothetical protein
METIMPSYRAAFLVCFLATASSACTATTGPVVADPYDSCDPGDDCSGGLACAPTTLPVSSGFTGNLCTSGCNVDNDCLQLVNNYDAVCVNGQCYLTCPSSDSCPYGQGCFTFDSNTGPISLCTP